MTRFTTKAVIIDGVHSKAVYSMKEDGTLQIRLTGPEGQQATVTLTPDHEMYQAARMAYDIKCAKRAGSADLDSLKGLSLKGRGYTILMDASIERCTVTFSGMPSKAIRDTVKAAGFWWTPSHKCWTRKLNNESWIAAQLLHQKLSA